METSLFYFILHIATAGVLQVAEDLGHDSEKTTLIYLSTLDTSEVDNANSVILAALVNGKSKILQTKSV